LSRRAFCFLLSDFQAYALATSVTNIVNLRAGLKTHQVREAERF
jgi:hypothetical protein